MKASSIGTLELEFIDALTKGLGEWDEGIKVGSQAAFLEFGLRKSSISKVEQLNKLNQGRWGSLKSCKKERVDEQGFWYRVTDGKTT